VPLPATRAYSALSAGQLKPMYEAIAAQIASSDISGRILDIGTGLGYLPIELAKVRPDSCIFGVDESANMIRLAKSSAWNARLNKHVEFSSGDYDSLPFPGRYFDFAVSVNALHHWESPAKVLDEVFHVLLPGAQFWTYDYRNDVPDEVWDNIRASLPIHQKTMLLFGPAASSRAAFTDEEIRKFIRQTHFKEIGIEQISLPLFGMDTPAFNLIKMLKL